MEELSLNCGLISCGEMPLRSLSVAVALLAQHHHRESVEKDQRYGVQEQQQWVLALPSLNYGNG